MTLQSPPGANKTRVLMIDDSVVIRRILSDVLGAHPDIEVVGTANNGSVGLERIAQLKPDIVVMDIEMPVMDGLQTLKALRQTDKSTPVIMFSTLTGRGAKATLEALSLGATDYVTKPANVGSVNASLEEIRQELIPRVLALGAKSRNKTGAIRAAVRPNRPTVPVVGRPAKAVVIGVSTGGPRALQEMLPGLPADLAVPVLIVQHMPPIFTTQLAQRLDSVSPLTVVEAAQGDVIRPGMVFVAPGDFHMVPHREGTEVKVRLHQGPPQNSCRPAVDELFTTAAALWGGDTLGVVMTGMGQDGSVGAKVIRNAGGRVIAQDEATSVVWGMPGKVFEDGTAEEFVPLEGIASAIVARTRSTAAAARPVMKARS